MSWEKQRPLRRSEGQKSVSFVCLTFVLALTKKVSRMAVVKVTDLISEVEGTSRDLGRELARQVRLGDCVDLNGFDAISNSFVDEFVKCFLQRFEPRFLDTVKFVNASQLFTVLFERAKKRHFQNVLKQTQFFNFKRQSFLNVSS